jgi:hypothetical protein
VLDPGGAVQHLEGVSCSRDARARLRELVTSLDKTKGAALRARDADGLLDGWSPLFDARWSLVDHFESDGKRFVIAAENWPRANGKPLTRREAQVSAYFVRGFTSKEIAYELGIADSTVRVLLSRVRRRHQDASKPME